MVTMKQLVFISETYVVWRRRLVFSKSLVFIWCLALASAFVEYRVVNILMDFFNVIWDHENLRRAAILANLQDGLSDIFLVYTYALAAFTGHFSVIIYGTASYVTGLMLFWATIWASKVSLLTSAGAICLIAFGKAGVPVTRKFMECQLKEAVARHNSGTVHTQLNEEEEENDHEIRLNIWWRSARISGALLATFSPSESYWYDKFKNSALALVSSYLLFFSGYIFYAFKTPTGTPLTKICRVFKAALCKLTSDYPATLQVYYWKNQRQNSELTYTNRTGKVRFLPRFLSWWGWLDKAAIIRDSSEAPALENRSPERQERNWVLCTVKDVREVKRSASLVLLFLTLIPYSLLAAAGNTFFVEQASNMKENLKINALFLLKTLLRDIALFVIWIMNLRNHRTTMVRIGVGLFVAVLCCLVAWQVEHRRRRHGNGDIHMGTAILVPQFLLLGLMEALVDNGVEQLYDNYVPESMSSFAEPFSGLLFGIGKLLTIPFALIITGWFKDSINASHIDMYFLMLAILNFVFVFIYGYCSTKYKEDDYRDDEVLTTHEVQEITETRQEASEDETHRILVKQPSK